MDHQGFTKGELFNISKENLNNKKNYLFEWKVLRCWVIVAIGEGNDDFFLMVT